MGGSRSFLPFWPGGHELSEEKRRAIAGHLLEVLATALLLTAFFAMPRYKLEGDYRASAACGLAALTLWFMGRLFR